LRAHTDEIHNAGAELVIVGNGSASFAKGFQKQFNVATPLYVDPDLTAYRAAGLRRTKLGTIGPRVWLPAIKAFLSGHRQGKVQGDPYQQGGVFVVLPGDKLAYSHICKRSSEHPKVAGVLKALHQAQP
jgi:hypothetical protein